MQFKFFVLIYNFTGIGFGFLIYLAEADFGSSDIY